jgi:2-dehydro-3-deoxyphosphogluconate aldolase/(4S)-4-hydroxy-2-oxoglutarate aldolase
MNRNQLSARIEAVGIIAAIRVSRMDDALFAANAVIGGGIPVIEVALTVPDATKVISQVLRDAPGVIVGAGSVSDVEAARACLDAGAQFLTSDGFDSDTVKFAVQHDVVVIPGALTPTEIISAWKLRPDFVKIVPCGLIGADHYIRSLRAMFPELRMIAAGSVNQQTAFDYIWAGATALGIGRELLPRGAIRHREPGQIAELAGRFLKSVTKARNQLAAG